MKLVDKQVVEATKPKIYIGRRTYVNQRTGQTRIAKPYWAEYFVNGRQYQEPLKTPNKAAAIRAAYALADRLEQGHHKIRDGQKTVDDLREKYYTYCAGRNRAKKTLVKYKGQLKRFTTWCRSVRQDKPDFSINLKGS